MKALIFFHVSISGLTYCHIGRSSQKFWAGYGSKCCASSGVYDENLSKCCKGQIFHAHALCGSLEYDKCTQICCNQVIQQKIGRRTSCCGETAYDTTTHICCNRELVPKYACWYKWSYEVICDRNQISYKFIKGHKTCLGKSIFFL